MDNIRIKDPQQLRKKISLFKKAGFQGLHVVSDFDRTLTKAFTGQKRASSSIAKIREGGYLGEEFSRKGFELFDKYHPFEISPTLSLEEKSRKMLEWWTKHLELTIQYGLTKEILEKIGTGGSIEPRLGLFDFLTVLEKNNIPLLVFSSGLGDVIQAFFRFNKILTKNVHIIANFYKFKEGIVTGYESNIIHVYNKNEVAVRDTPYQKEIQDRKNVLMLGDSLGDLMMTEGIEHDSIIRIGFLNELQDSQLSNYMDSFDIVILGDGNMDEVNKLLKSIGWPYSLT